MEKKHSRHTLEIKSCLHINGTNITLLFHWNRYFPRLGISLCKITSHETYIWFGLDLYTVQILPLIVNTNREQRGKRTSQAKMLCSLSRNPFSNRIGNVVSGKKEKRKKEMCVDSSLQRHLYLVISSCFLFGSLCGLFLMYTRTYI